MRALLDVNVLIALLDGQHAHHALAADWLAREIGVGGWASCPITHNGCIRILSQPAYPNGPFPAAEVAQRLAQACAGDDHQFWADDVDLLKPDTVNWANILGHRQITDAYLLALAVRHQGRFVTLDRRLDIRAVAGAKACNLHILG